MKTASSFRDPKSFIYEHDSEIYRVIDVDDYTLLTKSGLYNKLTSGGMLIEHEEMNGHTIKPLIIPFISYPYEWCFSQLKDAALLTLDVQETALKFGMTLKDASAYNVQFVNCRPVFIDTGSFTKYIEGQPWIAYRQFCQHFLAPLLLMSYKDVRLNVLLRDFIDGIPLDLASALLPMRLSTLAHIHLHAKGQKHFADKIVCMHVGRIQQLGVFRNLRKIIEKLHPKSKNGWSDYKSFTYSNEALEHKKTLVDEYTRIVRPETVWDLGGNVGTFSPKRAVCFDSDPASVERAYLSKGNYLPLLLDLTNPSPGIGWNNKERTSLIERGPADLVLALALVHHLAISNNTPLEMVAQFLSRVCRWLVIEFVPKEDVQVQKLLRNREDIFSDYHQQMFEQSFGEYFVIHQSSQICDSVRTLYLMEKK